MMIGECEIGVAGLAVMGQNLALNFAEKGIKTAVFNRTASRVDDCLVKAQQENVSNIWGFKDLGDFVKALQRPRKIIIMIKAGNAVDQFIEWIIPYLESDDLLIDAGNEWYKTSEKRMEELKKKGFQYIAMGVSGGEDGARHGPALMPGGDLRSYELIASMMEKIAAKSSAGPCVTYIGPRGAGNYVKMVHNGIEYGDMQLIAEAYHLLKYCGGLSNDAIHETFKTWNRGKLQSFLIEKTAKIFAKKDDMGDGYLIDQVLDVAGSKGTGAWTVQESVTRQVPCPTLIAALTTRYISAYRDLRYEASKVYNLADQPYVKCPNLPHFIDDLEASLYCAKICSYSQGLMLLSVASSEEKWNLNLCEISRTWMSGCIIQAEFLKDICEAYRRNPNLVLLLLEKHFVETLKQGIPKWRRIVETGVRCRIAIPALAASLEYFDSLICTQLSTNLIQAQRDAFGAHGFQRIDNKDGPFHSSWAPSF